MIDAQGIAKKRYDAIDGTSYLLRPDQHITARWRGFDHDRVISAVETATANC